MISIDYDPEVLKYEDLLEIFWSAHRCDQINTSRQYMNAVFYHDESQKIAAVSKAKEYGLRMGKKLKVAGAYHSRLMAGAQEQLGEALASTEFVEPSIPVVSNFLAISPEGPDAIRASLKDQVTGSVRWIESIRLLREQGNDLFIELGPGKVLAGFMARIDKEARIISIEDAESLEAAVAELS